MSTSIECLDTPVAVVDVGRMMGNVERMQHRAQSLGVRLRPHVKTTKCAQVVEAQIQAGARGITVSTLKEAQAFFAQGVTDILYAVAMAPTKLAQALDLRRAGCALIIVTDSAAGARAIVEFGNTHNERFEVFIEIDSDHHRSGVRSDDPLLIEIASVLHQGDAVLKGVMTHAGESYKLNTLEALQAIAELERSECVKAAEAIRSAGIPCPEVSVGSTPTALCAVHLEGVTELRAGVYVFFDLVMHNVGVCALEDLALSVLTTVIGHQPDKGWIITDSGWMAMSRDQGTQSQQRDFGYGLVCDSKGTIIEGLLLRSANQEHGVASFEEGKTVDVERFTHRHPTAGSAQPRLRNGAQYQAYEALLANSEIAHWSRINGW